MVNDKPLLGKIMKAVLLNADEGLDFMILGGYPRVLAPPRHNTLHLGQKKKKNALLASISLGCGNPQVDNE